MNKHAKAYYVGRKADADDGLTGEDSRGVQAIVQDHDGVGREIVTSADYYVRDGDGWRGVDINGLFDYLLDHPDVAFGRTVSQEEYNAVMREVSADKHGYTPHERKAS